MSQLQLKKFTTSVKKLLNQMPASFQQQYEIIIRKSTGYDDGIVIGIEPQSLDVIITDPRWSFLSGNYKSVDNFNNYAKQHAAISSKGILGLTPFIRAKDNNVVIGSGALRDIGTVNRVF